MKKLLILIIVLACMGRSKNGLDTLDTCYDTACPWGMVPADDCSCAWDI